MLSDSHHENVQRQPQTRAPSARLFGLVFTSFFLVVGLLPVWRGEDVRMWALMTSGFLLFIALVAPGVLRPLMLLWIRLGSLFGEVIGWIALSILFYGLVTLTGLLMRLFGGDLLRLKFDREAATYWIDRKPPGPAPGSFDKQF